MGFQKVSGQYKYFKYNECNKGDILVKDGTYLGQQQGKYGIQYHFRQADGQAVILNASGHLDWLIRTHVTTGERVNITYDGLTLLTKGPFAGKEAHTFELEKWDGKTKVDNAMPEMSVSEVSPTSEDISL